MAERLFQNGLHVGDFRGDDRGGRMRPDASRRFGGELFEGVPWVRMSADLTGEPGLQVLGEPAELQFPGAGRRLPHEPNAGIPGRLITL